MASLPPWLPLLLLPLLLLPLLGVSRAGAASADDSSQRACVVSFSRSSGAARRTCLDISAICGRLRCGAERACALDPAGKPSCLPAAVRTAQNCGSEDERLAQPCPDGAAVLGFGQGCTFCEEAAPPVPAEAAEAVPAAGEAGRTEAETAGSSRRAYTDSDRRRGRWDRPDTTQTPEEDHSQPLSACVVVHTGLGRFKRDCVDISGPCRQRSCPAGTTCGLNLEEQVECFPESVKSFENCGSEELRLSQPCPADAGIVGFGQGCTFCRGGNPFGPPTPAQMPRACVFVHIGSGEFKTECTDISGPCRRRSCPSSTVCGLNLDEQIECFPESVKEFENCHSEELRLSQPCPADAGIVGFGQGCTFCKGGNPIEPEVDEPMPKACVVIHIGSGEFKSECMDISSPCQQRSCPSGTVCGLNLKEQIECFPESVKSFENCGPEEFRLSQPCPADAGIVGFGEGCTFCGGGNPFGPPAPEAAPNACVVIPTISGSFKRQCYDISAQCGRRACPPGTVCGLDLAENTVCFPRAVKRFENCRPEIFRLQQPCPADARIRGFGQGCTFCVGANPWQTPPTRRPTGWPTGQPAGRPIGRPTGRPVGRPTGRPVGRPTGRPVGRPTGRPVGRPTGRPVGRPTGRPVGRPTGRPIGRPTGRPVGRPTQRPATLPSRAKPACISRRLANGQLRRGCRDIAADCRRLACGPGLTCALDPQERPRCFSPSQLPLRNCRQPRQRLAQPCPAAAQVVAFGAGCTFCAPRAATPSAGRACVAHQSGQSFCVDISQRCARIRCGGGARCVLDRTGSVMCLPPARQRRPFCGTEQQRLRMPCGRDIGATPMAFGPKCNYCF